VDGLDVGEFDRMYKFMGDVGLWGDSYHPNPTKIALARVKTAGNFETLMDDALMMEVGGWVLILVTAAVGSGRRGAIQLKRSQDWNNGKEITVEIRVLQLIVCTTATTNHPFPFSPSTSGPHLCASEWCWEGFRFRS